VVVFCIEVEAMSNKGLVPTDHRDLKAREMTTNTFCASLSKISGVTVKQVDVCELGKLWTSTE
jgi:hypothetical protein